VRELCGFSPGAWRDAPRLQRDLPPRHLLPGRQSAVTAGARSCDSRSSRGSKPAQRTSQQVRIALHPADRSSAPDGAQHRTCLERRSTPHGRQGRRFGCRSGLAARESTRP